MLNSTTPDLVDRPFRDLVARHPTVTPDLVRLVGYDHAGDPRIAVEVAADRDTAPLSEYILTWVRAEYPAPAGPKLSLSDGGLAARSAASAG